ESLISIYGLTHDIIFKTLGFNELGVPEKITVVDTLTAKVQKNILKTASGFGGSNAAVVFAKD
nr:beta-ACP synthase [Bacteroidales bacterium]